MHVKQVTDGLLLEKNGVSICLSRDELQQIVETLPGLVWASTNLRSPTRISPTVAPAEVRQALAMAWGLVEDDCKERTRGLWQVAIRRLLFPESRRAVGTAYGCSQP